MNTLTALPTFESLLSAYLFKSMLGMQSASIVVREDSTAKSSTVCMESYSFEHLLHEYERRYGTLSWVAEQPQWMKDARLTLRKSIRSNQWQDIERNVESFFNALLSNDLRRAELFYLELKGHAVRTDSYTFLGASALSVA